MNVPPEPLEFPDPPGAMIDFIRRLPEVDADLEKRRRRPRRVVAMTCSITPLNAAMEPIAEAFHAVTRDVSTIGVSILVNRMLECPFIQVGLPRPGGTPIQVLARMVRCRKLGPYFDVAGELIERTDAGGAKGRAAAVPTAAQTPV